MRRLILGALCALLPSLHLTAANSDSAAPDVVVGQSAIDQQTCVALTQAHRYAFLIPRGWSLAREARGLRLHSPSQEAGITIRFSHSGGAREKDGDWKQRLIATLGQAEIGESASLQLGNCAVKASTSTGTMGLPP